MSACVYVKHFQGTAFGVGQASACGGLPGRLPPETKLHPRPGRVLRWIRGKINTCSLEWLAWGAWAPTWCAACSKVATTASLSIGIPPTSPNYTRKARADPIHSVIRWEAD